MQVAREPQTFAERIAEFICECPADAIPTNVRDDAVLRVLDTIGVALLAYQLDGARTSVNVIKRMDGGSSSTVVGSSVRTSAVAAAFANGSLAHWPDFDDTDSFSMLHPSSVVVPAALALAEELGSSGAAALDAMIVGAEVGMRVARCGQHKFQSRGYHATGSCGPFTAAAVASRLLGLKPRETVSALGIAGCLAGGLLQGHSDGSWAKRYFSGWSAHTGIMAASLAAAGAIGSAEIFEGGVGFYRVLLGALPEPAVLERLTSDLGETWALPQTTFKPYPSAAWTHSAIDALIAIMKEHALTQGDIDAIECRLPLAAIPLVCEPRAAKIRPKTPFHMKLSAPFTIAMAAVLGHVEAADFNDTLLHDERLIDLASRVNCIGDAALPPQGFPATLTVTSRKGGVYRHAVAAQRGDPANPMTRSDLLQKFTRNAGGMLGESGAQKLADAIFALPAASTVRTMMDLTRA
ncbi:MAG: MmgE/PrpD family protein [Vulcanimicrobiaceae bacterium]